MSQPFATTGKSKVIVQAMKTFLYGVIALGIVLFLPAIHDLCGFTSPV